MFDRMREEFRLRGMMMAEGVGRPETREIVRVGRFENREQVLELFSLWHAQQDLLLRGIVSEGRYSNIEMHSSLTVPGEWEDGNRFFLKGVRALDLMMLQPGHFERTRITDPAYADWIVRMMDKKGVSEGVLHEEITLLLYTERVAGTFLAE